MDEIPRGLHPKIGAASLGVSYVFHHGQKEAAKVHRQIGGLFSMPKKSSSSFFFVINIVVVVIIILEQETKKQQPEQKQQQKQ